MNSQDFRKYETARIRINQYNSPVLKASAIFELRYIIASSLSRLARGMGKSSCKCTSQTHCSCNPSLRRHRSMYKVWSWFFCFLIAGESPKKMLTQKQTANVFIQFFSQIPSQTNQKESAADKINWKEGLTWEETYSSFYRLAIFSHLNQITWYDFNCKMLKK